MGDYWALKPKFWKHLFEDANITLRSGPQRSEVILQKSKAQSFDPWSTDFVKENHFCNFGPMVLARSICKGFL